MRLRKRLKNCIAISFVPMLAPRSIVLHGVGACAVSHFSLFERFILTTIPICSHIIRFSFLMTPRIITVLKCNDPLLRNLGIMSDSQTA